MVRAAAKLRKCNRSSRKNTMVRCWRPEFKVVWSELRLKLALAAFSHTAAYGCDFIISRWSGEKFPATMSLSGKII